MDKRRITENGDDHEQEPQPKKARRKKVRLVTERHNRLISYRSAVLVCIVGGAI